VTDANYSALLIIHYLCSLSAQVFFLPTWVCVLHCQIYI